MAQVNRYEGRSGYLSIDVTALANAGTVDITLPDPNYAECLNVVAEDDAGNVTAQSASTFTVVVNRVTNAVTFTNATGAAYTGTYKVHVII